MPRPTKKLSKKVKFRALETWRLNTVEGLTMPQIAERTGLSLSSVQRDLRVGAEQARQYYEPQVQTYFEQALGQLDYLLLRIAERIRESEQDGRLDLAAVKEFRACSESKRKLLGIDRNKDKIEISGVGKDGAVKIEQVQAEIVALAQARKIKLAEAQAQAQATVAEG